MKILCIDSSTKNLSLALADKDGVKYNYNKSFNKGPVSESIIPEIKNILKKVSWCLSEIDVFCVGLGPGSFTGLRVGVATIKGLAFALNKPIIGFSSLDLLAMNVNQDGQVCVIVDAKRDLVFSCVYDKLSDSISRKSEYVLSNIDDVISKLNSDVIFIGDAVPLYKEKITESQINLIFIEDETRYNQNAKYLWYIAQTRLEKKDFDSIEGITPLYLYSEDCQVRRK